MTDAKIMKTVRKKLNLTQVQMAKRMGYAYQKDISRLENGGNMCAQTKAHLKTIQNQQT